MSREVLPVETWRDEHSGLRGPFAVSGNFFGALGTRYTEYELAPPLHCDEPPFQLAEVPMVGRGFAELKKPDVQRLSFNVWFTNAERPEDLGSFYPDECLQAVSMAELTIYGMARSIMHVREGRFAPRRHDARSRAFQGAYAERILSAAEQSGLRAPDDCDPVTDPYTGKPIGRGAELLRKVEDAVHVLESDPSDPNYMGMVAADLVYTNTLQWLIASRIGNRIEESRERFGGRLPNGINIILPAEHYDMQRKLIAAGIPMMQVYEADIAPTHIDEGFSVGYQEAMRHGRATPEMIWTMQR